MRIGLMGFGLVGRQVFQLALNDAQFDLVAISDIGRPEMLHHLLTKAMSSDDIRLQANHLVSERNGAVARARLMRADKPAEVPWDAFGVDLVIDATGRFRSAPELAPHLENGARRVILSTLPDGDLDQVVLYGVNQADAKADDRIVSAGSASTTATALALKTLAATNTIEHATVTSVHAYTSDQRLQDYAGPDYRRSRSGAENIIPNDTPAPRWVGRALPAVKGKVSGFALNVPVQAGSLLDLTVAFADPDVSAEGVNAVFEAAAAAQPALIATTSDPIVSSDVKGRSESLLVDLKGTMKAGQNLIKVLAWHESLGHARRILDLAALYGALDAAQAEENA